MTSVRARIVKREGATASVPLLPPGVSQRQRKSIPREELVARVAAERVVREAHVRAGEIVAAARKQAGEAVETARTEARTEADRELVARWLALREAEARRAAADVDRILPVAVVLAERLVCASLELEPAHIARLAAGVFAEARGARRATIHAHPVDADALRGHLSEAGLDPASVEIRPDPSLARGALRLHTDVGIIDAQLAPRLERLAETLRDAFR